MARVKNVLDGSLTRDEIKISKSAAEECVRPVLDYILSKHLLMTKTTLGRDNVIDWERLGNVYSKWYYIESFYQHL